MKKLKQKLGDCTAYLYIAPTAVLMLIFIVYSLFSSIGISLTQWKGMGEKTFIGLNNYFELLKDATFWSSLKIQFIWVIMSVVLLAVGGLILSLVVEFFIHRKLIPAVRTIFFMPMMISLVAVGILWALIYNPMIGLLNEVIENLGLLKKGQVLDLLGNNSTALYAAFIPAFWQWSGFGMVIFSAAIQGIPNDVIEAARVDGCSILGRLRYIILPLLRPTIAMVCTLNLIGGFKCFDLLFTMTKGGPGIATQSTTIYIYKEMFVNGNYGYSAAMAIILFIVTVFFSLFFFQVTRRFEN